ncbi:MAG: hypothetical protein ACK55U_13975, partial [Bacteroidota bacterium]
MKLIFTLTLLFFGHLLFALSELAKRNGFKDIKLGMLVDSVKGAVFKKDIVAHKEFPAKIYEVEHPEYAKVGSVPVKRIE